MCDSRRPDNGADSSRQPVSGEPHVHVWKREYAPNYRQASEADDWREECVCGAFRSGSGESRTEHRWEEWARRLAPLIHDGLIDTRQERQIIDKAFYLARLLDEHLS